MDAATSAGMVTPLRSRSAGLADRTPTPLRALLAADGFSPPPISEVQEIEERWFGQISTHITGVAHYDGKVSDREEVVFEGKMVMNANGEQIGWLPKEISPLLLPVIKRQGDGMHVEGIVPRGSKNKFKVPLDLQVYGQASDAEAIREVFDVLDRERPQYAGLQLIRGPPEGFKIVDLDVKLRERRGQDEGFKGLNFTQLVGDRARTRQQDERELERVFEPPVPYEAMREAAAPSGLKATLYQHQRKALHWMLTREEPLTAQDAHSQGLPCIWLREAEGRCVRYRNVITNTTSRMPPPLPRGGVLADDMGMGKTVSMVALLVARRLGTTLVICPLSVLPVWEKELHLFAPSLKVIVFHGQGRTADQATLKQHDVVLTTYRTLEQQNVLRSVQWYRAVLDEAHEVRNAQALQSKACAGLNAEVRWCLTGTPLLNGLKDLYGLVAFLKIQPFSEHRWWLRMIARPAKMCHSRGIIHLKHLLGAFLLRRTKDLMVKTADGLMRPVLELPERAVRVERVPLSPKERELYDKFHGFAIQRIQALRSQDSHILQLNNALVALTQLRQMCCAMELLPPDVLNRLQGGDDPSELQHELSKMGVRQRTRLLRQVAEAPGVECSICLEPLLTQEPCATPCPHLFHRSCLLGWLGSGCRRVCPLCNARCEVESVIALPDEDLDETVGLAAQAAEDHGAAPPESTKLAWTANFIAERAAEHKVVVFSHFVRLLSQLASRLDAAGLGFTRLQGDMSSERRAAAVKSLQDDSNVRVILCSIRCAGVGITLTAADTVVILDPWWNRSVEEQAVDRVHRIGQSRKVEVVRLVAQDTVEEQMLSVQDLKSGIFECALSRRDGRDAHQTRLDVTLNVLGGPWSKAHKRKGQAQLPVAGSSGAKRKREGGV